MAAHLTPRLEKIATLVSKGSIVADIGTDHGYIPIYLVKNQIIPRAIAGDVNEKPLESARSNIASHGLQEAIETRLGSGLSVLSPGEVNTVIVAGMGGMLISELLEAAKEVVDTVDTFILQPMQAQDDLRRYLVHKGFQIEQDILIKEDHRIYEILVATKGQQRVEDEIQYEIGFHILSNPKDLAREFIQSKIRAVDQIMEQIKDKENPSLQEKYEACKNKRAKLEEVLQCLTK